MDPAPDAALLTIVRHGQTSANLDRVWHGSTNTPLTDHGQRQAAAVAAHIDANLRPVTALYASPLDRARHTAHAIGERLGIDAEIDRDLAEYDLGAWEGRSFEWLVAEQDLFGNMQQDPHYAPHGGESPLAVADRLAGALRRIGERHAGERIVVVSHGGALSLAFGVLLEGDYSNWSRMMDNCAISELALDPRPRLLRFNEVAHLPPGGPAHDGR